MRGIGVLRFQTTLAQRAPRTAAIAFGSVLALLLAAPLAGPYYQGLATEILIFAIFAMSLDLLMGYTGMLSLGHAAFFGIGAYSTVLVATQLGANVWLAMAAGILLSAAGAAVIGAFCIRVSGITFLMLTMAFAQLLYSAAVKWRGLTGGTDGIGGLERPSLWGASLDDGTVLYYVVLGAFAVTFWLLMRLIRSPLGSVMIGIRENEQRMRAIGYPVQSFKLLAFVIAGTIGGFAGTLYALFNAFVSPEVLSWHLSGDGIVMVILGGTGSIVGPIIGAAAFLSLRNVVSSVNEYWLLWVGVAFVACVLFMPKGLWGFAARLSERNPR
jgi:branched-chain amino acid transport system permease protein